MNRHRQTEIDRDPQRQTETYRNKHRCTHRHTNKDTHTQTHTHTLDWKRSLKDLLGTESRPCKPVKILIPQRRDMKNRLKWPPATLLCIQAHHVSSKETGPKESPQVTTSYAALHPGASRRFHRDETGGIAGSDHQLCCNASRCITWIRKFQRDETGGIALSDHQLCGYASRCITLQVHGTGQVPLPTVSPSFVGQGLWFRALTPCSTRMRSSINSTAGTRPEESPEVTTSYVAKHPNASQKIPQRRDRRNRRKWPPAMLRYIQVHHVNSTETRPEESS